VFFCYSIQRVVCFALSLSLITYQINDKKDFITETIIEASAKDIDLRLLPSNPIESIKKRASSDKSDEPNAKKSKSEKIDM
jgi:hypothetical protein